MADTDTISSMMEEKRVFPPSDEFCNNARVKSFEEYKKLYEESIKDPEKFWEKIAREELDWFNDKWDSVFEWDSENAKFSWFKGGKINVSYQCLDRHLKTWRKNKAALIWQGEPEEDVRTFTYAELYHEVCKFANVLKNLGIKKGDRVAVYLPMIPELAITLLSCARIGAIHSVVFGGFSADALRDRINDSECKLLVTADGYYRNGKNITAKQNADAALDGSPSVKKAVVVRRLGVDISMNNGRDVWWHEEMEKVNGRCEAEELDAEDPLFILYTSGSTGKPKGVMHTNAGYILYTQTTFKYIFDHREEDTYWCTADIGWITGHSYIVYGPLATGATSIMFEGVPTYPGPDRWWHMVEKFKVTTFYTAPTAIRALMAEGLDHVNKHDLSTLRLLGSVGEPINPEAWMWYYNNVGKEKCPIVDTWWQTETGGILIAPMPGATPLKPGSATFPFFGIEPAIIREDGTEADQNEGGYLVIRKPWPGLMRGVYNQPQRFKETYWSQYPGNYFSGDGARRDSEGYFWLMGRVDDVIKVSGHRIGTAEVESALVAHPKVAEAAVVPMPHEIKGEAIYAFVRLNSGEKGNDELVKELGTYVRTHLGPIARPDKIQFAKDLPKTRSGKIMRRILKKIASNQIDQVGDTSTLADPSVVDAIVAERL